MEPLDLSCLGDLDLEWADGDSAAVNTKLEKENSDRAFLEQNARLITTGDDEYDISLLVEKCVKEEASEIASRPPLSQALRDHAEFCQDVWLGGIVREWLLAHKDAVYLLTGDAGTGKTKTIKKLARLLQDLNPLALCLTAPTHKAVSILGAGAKTTPSAMGFTFEMCTASFEEFKSIYSRKKAHAIAAWKDVQKNTAGIAATASRDPEHTCLVLDSRCAACCAAARAKMGRWSAPFIGASVVLIDEYSLLDAETFAKIKWCLDLFRLPGQNYAIIFSGSVSQLPPPGRTVPVWQTEIFRELHAWSYPLLINFRQVADPVFSNMLKHMQYNLVTPQGVALLNDRVVGPILAQSPLYKPHIVRIFNANVRRDAYNALYSKYATEKITVPVIVVPDKDFKGRTRCSQRDFFSYLRNMYSKVFSRMVGSSLVLHRGGFVELFGPIRPPGRYALVGTDQKHTTVKNILTDAVVKLPLFTCAYQGLKTAVPPVYPIQGINTYSCQGDTLEGGVVYCPPARQYMRSEIKPSAYVTMSRVTARDLLFLESNPFDAPGEYKFFTDDILTYKKQYEQCYRPISEDDGAMHNP